MLEPWAPISQRLRRISQRLRRISQRLPRKFQTASLPDSKPTCRFPVGFARISARYLGNFKLLIGSSGRPSHESNYYSILHILIADPQPRGRAAKALLSNPIELK